MNISATLTILAITLPMAMAGPAQANPVTIVDFDQTVAEQMPYFMPENYPNNSPMVWQDNSGVTISDANIEKNSEPTLTAGDAWYIGTSTLDNNTDIDQTLSTQSFSKQISQTLSTTVTSGIQTGSKVSASFEFAGIKGDVELNQTVIYSNADTQTSSEVETFTAPSQNIKVPAHTKAKVTMALRKVVAKGEADLKADLAGAGRYLFGEDAGLMVNIPIVDILGPYTYGKKPKAGRTPLPASLSYDGVNKKIKFNGRLAYTATYGTDMDVTVDLIPEESLKASMAKRTSYHYTISSQH
ncbi:ETX/MTX2 family pore-forming toxin [Streptomyces sp. NPDC048362]|uniref:ETX/MTX2 family pore-forming toxin n=1 Tax=Streptomyces sp. NPDC048362 TaxID=3365539 RepID=UPI003720919C